MIRSDKEVVKACIVSDQELASRYPYTKATLRNYWTKRKELFGEVFNFQNEELFIEDVIAEQKWIKETLWQLYQKTTNDIVKLGILRDLSSINKEGLEMMQSVGLMREDPDRLRHVVSSLLEALKDMPDIQKIVAERWLALANGMEIQV